MRVVVRAPITLILALMLSASIQAIRAAPLATLYSLLAASSVHVKEQDAAPHFPDSVEFTLKTSGFVAERAELSYSLVGEAVTTGLQADVAQPTADLDVSTTLDLSIYYIPPGAEVTYYWTLTSPTGETVDTPSKTFKMLDEGYSWKTLSDPQGRVSVHWYEGGRAFGQSLLDTATGALDRLQHDIGVTIERPAEIWVYSSQDDLLGALPQNIPEWVGGKAFPELALVLASITDDDYADLETRRVIPHELSHLVLYQATRNPYNAPPAWLDEGLAVHNQEAHDPSEEDSLKTAAEQGRLLPIKALSGSFGADQETAILSYAESRSVVDFIVDDPRYGPTKLAKTVAAFKDGVTYDDALEAGLGITVDELDKEWRAFLPYKEGSQNSAPKQVGPTSPAAWASPLAMLGLGIFLGFFLAGGLLLVVLLALRKRPRA
jgi:Peptidase MA superfamily